MINLNSPFIYFSAKRKKKTDDELNQQHNVGVQYGLGECTSTSNQRMWNTDIHRSNSHNVHITWYGEQSSRYRLSFCVVPVYRGGLRAKLGSGTPPLGAPYGEPFQITPPPILGKIEKVNI